MDWQNHVGQREILGQDKILNKSAHQQSQPAQTDEYSRMSFTGKAGEYFGIWFVCGLLTVLTFGIYAAKAKVRRNRYFYGNTILAGKSFDYHATGKQIFSGRAFLFVGFIIASIIASIDPILGGVVFIVIFFLTPWFIARGIRFNTRVVSYRNIRFDFTGGYGGAFFDYILGPLLAVLTLGLLAPFCTLYRHKYLINNLKYGDKAFSLQLKARQFYKAAFLCLLQIVLIVAVSIAIILGIGAISAYESSIIGVFAILLALVSIFAIVFIIFKYEINVRNMVWSTALIDGVHKTRSDLVPWNYFWIFNSSFIAILLSLGLMRPWADIRLAAYKRKHFAVCIQGEMEEILGKVHGKESAISAELLDFGGLDIGL